MRTRRRKSASSTYFRGSSNRYVVSAKGHVFHYVLIYIARLLAYFYFFFVDPRLDSWLCNVLLGCGVPLD